jgi:hypothetical protein
MSPSERHEPAQTVDCLGPDSRGRWLITTKSSQHIWDLDARTYQRLPGTGGSQFACDGEVVRLTRVERWLEVGDKSFIWFDDPDMPDGLKHWRRSSTLQRTEPLPSRSEGPR